MCVPDDAERAASRRRTPYRTGRNGVGYQDVEDRTIGNPQVTWPFRGTPGLVRGCQASWLLHRSRRTRSARQQSTDRTGCESQSFSSRFPQKVRRTQCAYLKARAIVDNPTPSSRPDPRHRSRAEHESYRTCRRNARTSAGQNVSIGNIRELIFSTSKGTLCVSGTRRLFGNPADPKPSGELELDFVPGDAPDSPSEDEAAWKTRSATSP